MTALAELTELAHETEDPHRKDPTGRPLLATWYRQATPGVAYVRAHMPARALPGKVMHRSLVPPWLTVDEDDDPVFLQEGGTAIWCHPGNHSRALLMSYQQETLGLRVLVEIDDNYLERAPLQDQTGWLMEHRGDAEYSREYHAKICTWADGVIVSTPYLAERYGELNENVYVCPNAVDPRDWQAPLERDDVLRIGWAASASHYVDEPIIRHALEWAVRQPNVEVYLIGHQPLDWRGDFIRKTWRDDVQAYRDMLTELRLDVGICALRPGPWADGKSDVKALEYAMAGALPVVSRVEPYRPWWDEVPTAVLSHDWKGILKELVADPGEVRRQAAAAHEKVLRERTITKSVESWAAAVAGKE